MSRGLAASRGAPTRVVAACLLLLAVNATLVQTVVTEEVAFLAATAVYSVSEGLLVRVENVFIVYAWFLVIQYGVTRSDGAPERHPADVAGAAPGHRP